ncbi:hypothetical protein [Streptomyces sp. NPDC020362]|uniref:hypothetical protein n=1 Tax=unclassified Streptomyces TaxID=2593676 RepID=UPI0033D7CF00
MPATLTGPGGNSECVLGLVSSPPGTPRRTGGSRAAALRKPSSSWMLPRLEPPWYKEQLLY